VFSLALSLEINKIPEQQCGSCHYLSTKRPTTTSFKIKVNKVICRSIYYFYFCVYIYLRTMFNSISEPHARIKQDYTIYQQNFTFLLIQKCIELFYIASDLVRQKRETKCDNVLNTPKGLFFKHLLSSKKSLFK
jgi:hypothetical protein